MTVYVLIELVYDDPETVIVKVFSSMEAARIAKAEAIAEIGDSDAYLVLIQTCGVK